MNIVEFLKNEIEARLTHFQKWMIWDEDDQNWEVYKNVKGIGKMLIQTINEEEAIKTLMIDD